MATKSNFHKKTNQQLTGKKYYQSLATAIALALGSTVHAATFTVTNTNDSGAGSLRQSVIDANNSSGADEIVFAPSLTGQTIILKFGEIDVSDELVITGPTTGDAKSIVIDGNQNSRIFNGTSSNNISLENLTLQNGRGLLPPSFDPNGGGAIRSDGALSLLNTTITNNKTAVEGYGEQLTSAVFSKTDITISNSTIINNLGRGLFAKRTVSLDQSKVTGNLLNGIEAETVILNKSFISGNSGFGISGNTVTLKDSTVSNNGINHFVQQRKWYIS